MKKSLVGMLAMGLLGLALHVSQASANSCSRYTTSWFNQGVDFICNFVGGGSAHANSMSGEVNPGVKGLIADLISTSNMPNGFYAYAVGIGVDSNGNDIAGCRTQNDSSTAQGQTVGDGDGCENGAKHRLMMVKAGL